MSELGGMTVNERFFAQGLDSQWAAAKQRRDRDAMIQLLSQVELADQAELIADAILARKESH